MTDEKFVFVSDLKEKKQVARSSFNKRTHTGKGGKVRFPSDYMSRKEKKAMNGEVQVYALNSPMTWDEFKAMPDDIKTIYVKAIRNRFHVSDNKIFEMLGVHQATGQRWFAKLGLGQGKNTYNSKDADLAGWYLWKNSEAKAVSEPAEEEKTVIEEKPVIEEMAVAGLEIISDIDPVAVQTLPLCEDKAIPYSGDMSFVGAADVALKTVASILGNAKVRVCVTWEVCPEEGSAEYGRC